MKYSLSIASNFRRLATLNRLVQVAVLMTSIGVSLASAVEIAPLTRIDVVPAVAKSGVSRTLTVNVVWPDACPPEEAVLSPEPKDNPVLLVVRLTPPATLLACAQVLTPISRQVTYTPVRPGKLPVIATIGDGAPFAEGLLVTQDVNAVPNLTGMWLGGAADFSVLHLTQSEHTDLAIVGTMNLFDRAGLPHWRLIHSGRRSPHNTIYANVSQFTTTAVTTCVGPLCPANGFDGRDEGIIEIEIQSENQIVVTAHVTDPMFPPGVIRFRTVMYRFPL